MTTIEDCAEPRGHGAQNAHNAKARQVRSAIVSRPAVRMVGRPGAG